MFILRIHALYRSRVILILLLIICAVALAVAIVSAASLNHPSHLTPGQGLLAVPFHAEVVYATAMPGCNKLSTRAEYVLSGFISPQG